MRIGRLYILSSKKETITKPAETVWIISLPFLPLMLWIKPKKEG